MADDKRSLVLKQTQQNLSTLIDAKMQAMPKGFNQTRFIQNCMTVLVDTKDIEKYDPKSIARTLLKGAFLGLDFFQKECYAIGYGTDLQFQTDYKGETKLAKKYSIRPIKDIYAKVVRAGDFFEEKIVNGQQTINFEPLPFSTDDIIGAFAVVMYTDGGMDYETMSTQEIETIKANYSKKSYKTNEYSKAWMTTPGEMYKKTVLRRLTKRIEKDFESFEQAQEFESTSDFVFNGEKKKTAVPDTFNLEKSDDIEYEDIPNGGNTEQVVDVPEEEMPDFMKEAK